MNYIAKSIINYLEERGFKVDLQTKLFEEEMIDSMELIDLIAFIEKKFSVEFTSDMYTKDTFSSVINMVAVVEELISACEV